MDEARARTGIAGLDNILCGGFVRGRVHIVEGSPGTGKSTLALQFLLTGSAEGESGLLPHSVRERGRTACHRGEP